MNGCSGARPGCPRRNDAGVSGLGGGASVSVLSVRLSRNTALRLLLRPRPQVHGVLRVDDFASEASVRCTTEPAFPSCTTASSDEDTLSTHRIWPGSVRWTSSLDHGHDAGAPPVQAVATETHRTMAHMVRRKSTEQDRDEGRYASCGTRPGPSARRRPGRQPGQRSAGDQRSRSSLGALPSVQWQWPPGCRHRHRTGSSRQLPRRHSASFASTSVAVDPHTWSTTRYG